MYPHACLCRCGDSIDPIGQTADLAPLRRQLMYFAEAFNEPCGLIVHIYVESASADALERHKTVERGSQCPGGVDRFLFIEVVSAKSRDVRFLEAHGGPGELLVRGPSPSRQIVEARLADRGMSGR